MESGNSRSSIILIGMPAAGKSSIGVILAKVLGYDFIDSDLLIQKAAGKKLKEIIEERGVDGFLALENEVNRGIDVSETVIATGGSAVYGKEAMEHFAGTGTIVYLKVPYEVLCRRLDDIRQRGVVLREGQTLRELYDERSRLYEKYADLIIEEENRNMEEILQDVLKEIEK